MKNVIVAKAIVFNSEGRLLALRRSESDERRPLQWDIPGGWVDEGEEILTAVTREIEEEAGLKIDPKTLELVLTQHAIKDSKDGKLNINWLFFIGLTESQEVKLSYEHSEAGWMTLDEALKEFEYDVQKKVFQHVKDNNLMPNR